MTPAELVALRNLEAAEQAVGRALAARDVARERLEAVTRRERRRESTRAHLRVVSQSSTATGWTSREPEQTLWPSKTDTG
jgi:hypothetical protein